MHPPRAIFRQPSRRSNADRLNVHVLLEKNGTREEEPEGQALIARGCSWAEELLRRHEAMLGGSPSDCYGRRTNEPRPFQAVDAGGPRSTGLAAELFCPKYPATARNYDMISDPTICVA